MQNMISTVVLASLLVIANSDMSLAENPGGPDYQKGGSKIDLHRRYPGDRPLLDGNARSKGPEQGAYIEQCTWHARDTLFGIPWGFTQHCQRQTLDTTQ